MDWVQIYLLCIMGLALLVNVYLLGIGKTTEISPDKRLFIYILSIPICLPYVGRVFGWW